MKTYLELLEIVDNGYSELTISPNDFIEFMEQHSANIPLLVGDKTVWVHLNDEIEKPFMEYDINLGEPFVL
jgi:hypothetical protein